MVEFRRGRSILGRLPRRLALQVLQLRAILVVEQRRPVDVRQHGDRHFEFQLRPFDQRLCDRAHPLRTGTRKRGIARPKFDELQIGTGAEQRTQQRKRRRRRLHQQVHQDFPDDRRESEARIVERAAHRQIQFDHAIAILQERDRELDRQRHRILARGLVAEFELIDAQMMLRVERPTHDVVMQVGAELALGDVVAGKFARIGIEDAELDVVEAEREIRVEGAAETHLSGDRHRSKRPNLAVQVDGGARPGPRRQAGQSALDRFDSGREIRRDRQIREVGLAGIDEDAMHRDR